MKEFEKPTHVKPSLYAHYFYELKQIAKRYGYNLMIHGSLHRDLDLVAVAWADKVKDHEKMIKAMASRMGGNILEVYRGKGKKHGLYSKKPNGRLAYVINLKRRRSDTEDKGAYDYGYYLDISVIPPTP